MIHNLTTLTKRKVNMWLEIVWETVRTFKLKWKFEASQTVITKTRLYAAAGVSGVLILSCLLYLRYKNRVLGSVDSSEDLFPFRGRDGFKSDFLTHFNLGHYYLENGDDQNCAVHFAKAVNFCENPQGLLSYLESCVTSDVNELIVQKLTSSASEQQQNGHQDIGN